MYCCALWTYINTIENIIKELIGSLLLQPQQHFDRFQRLLASLADFEQRNVVQVALKLIPREYLSSIVVYDDSDWWRSDMEAVSATATLINAILCDQYSRKATVISWLTSASGAGVGEGIAVRRATIAALGTKKADVEVIFDKSLKQFGDPLYATRRYECISPLSFYN
jgi:telomere length regulation protein